VFTDGRCELTRVSTLQEANGTLVGSCAAGVVPTQAVWDPCDATLDVCPTGSICMAQDIFDATTIGPERCTPYCDTAFHDGTQSDCQVLGAVNTGDGTPTCQTVSNLYPPNGPNTAWPTRLGLCGL
jgi:hypothetical protein